MTLSINNKPLGWLTTNPNDYPVINIYNGMEVSYYVGRGPRPLSFEIHTTTYASSMQTLDDAVYKNLTARLSDDIYPLDGSNNTIRVVIEDYNGECEFMDIGQISISAIVIPSLTGSNKGFYPSLSTYPGAALYPGLG